MKKILLLSLLLLSLCPFCLLSQESQQPIQLPREKTLSLIDKKLNELRVLSQSDKATIQNLKELTKTYDEILILYKEISANDKKSLKIYKDLLTDYEKQIKKNEVVIGSVSAVGAVLLVTTIVVTAVKFSIDKPINL